MLKLNLDYLAGEDQDQLWLLKTLKEKPPATILEVGDAEGYIGYILSRRGFEYFGSDLRGQLHSYEETLDRAFDVVNLGKYKHIQGDFVTLKTEGTVDIVIALSSLEHFGLQTYGELVNDRLYDVKAMKKIWDILQPGGVAYITVPFGKQFILGRMDGMYKEHPPETWEWRIYNQAALESRIIHDFRVGSIDYFYATGSIPGHDKGSYVSREVAETNEFLPDVSVGLRLIKDLDYYSPYSKKAIPKEIEVPLQVELAKNDSGKTEVRRSL